MVTRDGLAAGQSERPGSIISANHAAHAATGLRCRHATIIQGRAIPHHQHVAARPAFGLFGINDENSPTFIVTVNRKHVRMR